MLNTCLFWLQQLLVLFQFLHLLFLLVLQIGIKIFATSAGRKKYNSIIKKMKKKHAKIVLLGKAKLYTTEVIISKNIFDTYITHDELFQ